MKTIIVVSLNSFFFVSFLRLSLALMLSTVWSKTYFNHENNWIQIERRSSVAGGDDVYEGTVNRKHEWESTTKKASSRSWDKVYLTLRQGDLAVYKVITLLFLPFSFYFEKTKFCHFWNRIKRLLGVLLKLIIATKVRWTFARLLLKWLLITLRRDTSSVSSKKRGK